MEPDCGLPPSPSLSSSLLSQGVIILSQAGRSIAHGESRMSSWGRALWSGPHSPNTNSSVASRGKKGQIKKMKVLTGQVMRQFYGSQFSSQKRGLAADIRELPVWGTKASFTYCQQKLGGSSSGSKPNQGCRQQQAVVGSAQTTINQ